MVIIAVLQDSSLILKREGTQVKLGLPVHEARPSEVQSRHCSIFMPVALVVFFILHYLCHKLYPNWI